MVADSPSEESSRNGSVNEPVAIFKDGSRVEDGIQTALRSVRILHKKMGVPLVGEVNGKIVSIPPEEIVIDPPPSRQ